MKNRLLIMLNLVLLIAVFTWISFLRSNRIGGHDFTPTTSTSTPQLNLDNRALLQKYFPAAAGVNSAGEIVDAHSQILGRARYTLPCAPQVAGYGGAIPLLIVLNTQNVVLGVEVLPNHETPDFLASVIDAGLLKSWNNHPAATGVTLKVDAVSGATISSRAIIQSVRAGLAAQAAVKLTPEKRQFTWNYRILAGLVAIFGAVLCIIFKVKNPHWRQLQLTLNFILLGVISGSFISLSGVLTVLSGGVSWQNLSLVPILLTLAVLFPLLTGRKVYCVWFCPLGSAQELLGHLQKKKIKVPPRFNNLRATLATLLLISWAMGFGWIALDFELFPGLLWGTVGWGLRLGVSAILLLAIWIPRPYCRFLCPTGFWLDFLATSHHKFSHKKTPGKTPGVPQK